MSTRQDWLAQRKSGIGASESAALFGLHPYISALSLYESKIRETPDVDDDENERMEDGRVIEPRIAARYARATRRQIWESPGIVRHPLMPHMLCTPDAITGCDEFGRMPLELKWLENFGKESEVPEYIQVQQQQQIACLQANAGALAVLGSFRSFHHFDIPRHDAFISLLMEKVDEFWRRVQERRPPDADGSKATAEALKRLFPKDNQTTVFLPAEIAILVRRMEGAKAAAKRLKIVEDHAHNRLAAAIGEATFGVLPDGTKYSYKHQRREGYTVEAAEFRVLRRVKAK